MKNAIIAVLVIVVGVLAFVLVSDEDGKELNQIESSVETLETKTPKTSGDELSLADKGLQSVSVDIFEQTSLTSLDVSGNNLTGSLPSQLQKLQKLEFLDASDNKLTGIPAEIGQLPNLKTIDFSNNDLSGLPNEMGNLSSLETLDLRGNPNISIRDLDIIRSSIPNATILVD